MNGFKVGDFVTNYRGDRATIIEAQPIILTVEWENGHVNTYGVLGAQIQSFRIIQKSKSHINHPLTEIFK